MVTAAQAATKDFGNLPAGLQRAINELTKSKVDWRVALADFLIEEVNDYGFTPPDLRIDEVEFGTYLPSFSETDTTCKDLQIYVDTSGSMSEDDIAKILSEIQGIIEQFKSVTGFVNIFNASVLDQRFELENINFKNMPEIEGGGGTSFQACADHLAKMVAGGQEVSAVIMLTDGYADIPDEKDWMAPVVWLLTEDSMAKSITYGKVITINN